jgi:hypothetical protein
MNKQLRRKEISTCVASEGVAAVERATSKQPELHSWNFHHIAARQRFVGIVHDQPAPFSRGPRSACAGPRHSRVATGLPKPPGPFLLHSVSNRAYFCRERIGHLVTAPVVANACKSVPSNTTLATSRSRLMRGSLVRGRHDCPLSSGRQGPGDPQWPAQCNGLLSAISIGLHPAQER